MTLEEKLQAAEIRTEISNRLLREEAARLDIDLFWKGLIGDYDEAWSSGDVDRIMEFYDSRIVYQIAVSGTVRRRADEVRLSFTNLLAGLEDFRRQSAEYVVIDATAALVVWEASGRNLDGEVVRLSGGTRFDLTDDGLIIGQVDYVVFP